MKKCEYCKKRFACLEPSQRRFCSSHCRNRSANKNKFLVNTCIFCKKDFLVKLSTPKTRTCSKECLYAQRKKTIDSNKFIRDLKAGVTRIILQKNCEMCGKEIDRKHRQRTITCGYTCASKLRHKLRKEKAVQDGLANK